MKLALHEFSSKFAFDLQQSDISAFADSMAQFERKLMRDNDSADSFLVDGYCIVCNALRSFLLDYQYGGDSQTLRPNFRERLVCQTCSLNSRMRACIHLLERNLSLSPSAMIYATEQVTPLFATLKRRFPHIIGSEFLSDGTARGSVNTSGTRNEDMTCLTFPSGEFDAVLSFECLEHIPNYRAALAECRRILKPNGMLLLTAPFRIDASETLIRAIVGPDGTIKHIEPPEYHGDPINASGVLCYHHFGWDLLDDIKSNGFSHASVAIYASRSFQYLGGLQPLILAQV
jgi:SAM-dependent methyltransferase